MAAILITEVAGETILVCQALGCDWPGTVPERDTVALTALTHKLHHAQQERICEKNGHDEVNGLCLRCCTALAEVTLLPTSQPQLQPTADLHPIALPA